MPKPNRDLDDLVPDAREKAEQLVRAAATAGCPILITSTLRTFYEQGVLWAQGRTTAGRIVTHAKAGQSNHNWGYAFDVCFRVRRGGNAYQGPWDRLGALGRDLGLEWGGDWPGNRQDRPHFQLPTPFTWRARRAAALGELRRGGRYSQAAVRELQRALRLQKLYRFTVDGDFGPGTERGVQNLQRTRARGVPTGIVSPGDLDALHALIHGKAPR